MALLRYFDNHIDMLKFDYLVHEAARPSGCGRSNVGDGAYKLSINGACWRSAGAHGTAMPNAAVPWAGRLRIRKAWRPKSVILTLETDPPSPALQTPFIIKNAALSLDEDASYKIFIIEARLTRVTVKI